VQSQGTMGICSYLSKNIGESPSFCVFQLPTLEGRY